MTMDDPATSAADLDTTNTFRWGQHGALVRKGVNKRGRPGNHRKVGDEGG